MIEYANESVIKLLKQYDMLTKSLNFTTDLKQKNDICYQMTKIIRTVLEITNSIYEEKYWKVAKRSVYLMDEEKTRLSELINLINERRVYVNNQMINNKDLTGLSFDTGIILGEEKLEDYKSQLKIIDKYKNNMRLQSVLTDEIKNLDAGIKKANDKINNNKNLNRQLEEKMIKLLNNACEKLSLYELQEREKEIDLAYTELGYSLEKAKENAKIARRDCTEEIISECDNMLASITLEYERYKEKKLILKLINLYPNPCNSYEELLEKREEINNILLNITSSELYAIIGNELNKEYATIKLEQQDVATLKSLMEERKIKNQTLQEITLENDSEEFKGLLSSLLENEKKYQEKLQQESRKREAERLERAKQEEKRKLEEIAKRQKALEEERKKEIERRTKQLLVEKKNPVLMSTREEALTESEIDHKQEKISKSVPERIEVPERPQFKKPAPSQTASRMERSRTIKPTPKKEETSSIREDFFETPTRTKKIVDQGIPVIQNKNLDNKVVTASVASSKQDKLFPDIPLEKQDNIFPNFPDMNTNNSFFDENEFNDLSNYMEDDNKKSWF